MELEKDQHFLIDSSAIETLINALEINREDRILEIGSGSGNITTFLVNKKVPVLACEIDLKFKPFLEEIKQSNPNLSLEFSNVLEINWEKYNKIIGNIPFSVAEAVIQKSVENRISILSLLVSSGLKETILSDSKLGLIVSLFFEMNVIKEIGPESLSPPPKTVCFLIQLRRKEPRDKIEEILRDILTKNGKIKNAIIYSFTKQGKTKNQARKITEKLNIDKSVLEKPLKRITGQFIIRLREELSRQQV